MTGMKKNIQDLFSYRSYKTHNENMTEPGEPIVHSFGRRLLPILLIIAAAGLFISLNEIYTPHALFEGKKRILIPEGLGSRKIGALLRDEGVIRSKWAFITYVFFRNEATRLKPGEYTFFSDMTIPAIARDLIRGGATEILFTVPEGFSAAQIGKKLEETGILTLREFLDAAGHPNTDYRIDQKLPQPKNYADTFSFLTDKPWYVGLDGYLFPDTYRMYRDSEPEEIMKKMLENFGEKLTKELREEIKKQKKSVFDVITAASLIEKEVSSDEDRETVSGILWKRIDLGMPLQVDASINYITGGNDSKVSSEAIQRESPYNTYKNKGLPLGPITNPGISAIQAAVYPKKSPYLYYLSTPGGKTIFSRTLEEHNTAKRKYLTN